MLPQCTRRVTTSVPHFTHLVTLHVSLRVVYVLWCCQLNFSSDTVDKLWCATCHELTRPLEPTRKTCLIPDGAQWAWAALHQHQTNSWSTTQGSAEACRSSEDCVHTDLVALAQLRTRLYLGVCCLSLFLERAISVQVETGANLLSYSWHITNT
jgi:hypothetical protein